MEEVWVVEKRLMLREELHIKMKKSHVSEPGAGPFGKKTSKEQAEIATLP